MMYLKPAKVPLIFSLVVFFDVCSFGLVDAANWGAWGTWTRCNAVSYARRTRFRNCLDEKGETQRSAKCNVGQSKRTRQCEGCKYPLLTHRSTNNALYTIKSTHGFKQVPNKQVWCGDSMSSNEYVEISFKTFVRLTAVASSGYKFNNNTSYVSEYKIQYSHNGVDWSWFKDGEMDRVFHGGEETRKTESFPLITQYLRIYPVKYQQRACMNVQMYGCEYTCGGLITKKEQIHISSPDATQLVAEPNCLWRLEIPDAFKLQLLFPYLKLLCRNAKLQISDGTKSFNNGVSYEEICGPARAISPLVFHGNQLWVHYRSNATTRDIGFHLRANVFATTTLNNSFGVVHAPLHKHAYKHAIRYTWYIKSARNHTISVKIHKFESNNIIFENNECLGDTLVIQNQIEKKPKRFCDLKSLPQVFASTSGYLRIKYKAGTNNAKWKLHFTYQVNKHTGDDDLRAGWKGIMRVPSIRPANNSRPGNDTQLEVDAVRKGGQGDDGGHNVAAIISSTFAVVIVLVLVIALLHFLRRRKEFLKKHPYDCSTRPISHFGEEDSTPFINQNVLMWSDSNLRKNEKPKKKSLPHVTISLSDECPQRLSIIPAEALTPTMETPQEGDQDKEEPLSLIVSDAFTEECLQILGGNLNSSEMSSDPEIDSENSAQKHLEPQSDDNNRLSVGSTNSRQDMASASSLENFADCVSPAALQIARGMPMTSPEILKYLRHEEK